MCCTAANICTEKFVDREKLYHSCKDLLALPHDPSDILEKVEKKMVTTIEIWGSIEIV